MKKIILFFCLLANSAWAQKLDDVKILSVVPGKDNVEVKLQMKNGPKGSYFFVDIKKADPEAFEKLVLLMKKISKKDSYKLNLDILSFSSSPSGSYYRSDSVTFSGSDK